MNEQSGDPAHTGNPVLDAALDDLIKSLDAAGSSFGTAIDSIEQVRGLYEGGVLPKHLDMTARYLIQRSEGFVETRRVALRCLSRLRSATACKPATSTCDQPAVEDDDDA